MLFVPLHPSPRAQPQHLLGRLRPHRLNLEQSRKELQQRAAPFCRQRSHGPRVTTQVERQRWPRHKALMCQDANRQLQEEEPPTLPREVGLLGRP